MAAAFAHLGQNALDSLGIGPGGLVDASHDAGTGLLGKAPQRLDSLLA